MSETDTRRAMPAFFIPHGGGPCFFMDWTAMGGPADTWDRTADWLRDLMPSLPGTPKAIVLVSGHWEEDRYTASSAARPEMIFDYYGFPEHTYKLDYPAPGDPQLAQRIVALLAEAGLPAGLDPARGFDHGVFVPLLVAAPEGSIPVVPLSLRGSLDPEEHMRVGRALAPLRDEGVLIIGSGMSYHNMRAFRTPGATGPSAIFDKWLVEAIESEPRDRWDRLAHWASAPAGRDAHPREEHLLPLMVAAGAAEAEAGKCVFTDNVMMADISAFRFG